MYYAGVAQLVEHLPSKQDVESSRLFARSKFYSRGMEKRHLESLISSSSWFDSGSRNQMVIVR